jgi:hypothetical protein
VLRKHSVDDEPCGGAGLPAVGELSEIHAGTETHAGTEIHVGAAVLPDPALRPVTPVQQQRVVSVA